MQLGAVKLVSTASARVKIVSGSPGTLASRPGHASHRYTNLMSEAELRAELEAIVRKRYEPSFARQLARQERLAALSDEEWWEHHMQAPSSVDPRFKAMADGAKEYMIEHRFNRRDFLNGDGPQQMIDAEVAKVMPILIQVRLERNEDGPLTEEQYHAASIRTSQNQIAHMSGLFKDAVGKQTDPQKRDFMARFAANIELDMEDMKVLADPDIKQEQLDDVTSRITERMNELAKSLRPPED